MEEMVICNTIYSTEAAGMDFDLQIFIHGATVRDRQSLLSKMWNLEIVSEDTLIYLGIQIVITS